jgi:hypothetical protein
VFLQCYRYREQAARQRYITKYRKPRGLVQNRWVSHNPIMVCPGFCMLPQSQATDSGRQGSLPHVWERENQFRSAGLLRPCVAGLVTSGAVVTPAEADGIAMSAYLD